jgi:hypothetical protein
VAVDYAGASRAGDRRDRPEETLRGMRIRQVKGDVLPASLLLMDHGGVLAGRLNVPE